MDYRNMAEDVYEFILGHDLGRAHVLGHSMGAKTGMQLALVHPAEVQSLISADMAPRAYSPRHGKILEGMLSLNLNSFETRQQIEDALQPWEPDLTTRQFLLKNVRRNASGRFHWQIGLQEIFENYSKLSQAIENGRHYSGRAFFIRGERSEFLVEGDMGNVRRLFPKAQLTTVPEAGHLLHVESPQVFLAIVLEFLRGES
jgi:pimeloyl-ACP methyl ester carboxylesterase